MATAHKRPVGRDVLLSQQPGSAGGTIAPSSRASGPHAGPLVSSWVSMLGHSRSQTSAPPVPLAHARGPASSTQRQTLFQAAPSNRVTAMLSGAQFAPQPTSAPSGATPRHISAGGFSAGANVAP